MKVTPFETEDDDSRTNVSPLNTFNVTVSCNEATILEQPCPSTTHITPITFPSTTSKHNDGPQNITSGFLWLWFTTLFSYPPPSECQHTLTQPLCFSIHIFGKLSSFHTILIFDSSPKHRTLNSHNSTCSSPMNSNQLHCSHDSSPNNTSGASFAGLEHSATDAKSNDFTSQPNPHSSILSPSTSPKETFLKSIIPYRTKCKPSSHVKPCRRQQSANSNLQDPSHQRDDVLSWNRDTKAGYCTFLRLVMSSGRYCNLLSKAHGFTSTVQNLLRPLDHDTKISVSFPNGVDLSIHLPKSTSESTSHSLNLNREDNHMEC